MIVELKTQFIRNKIVSSLIVLSLATLI